MRIVVDRLNFLGRVFLLGQKQVKFEALLHQANQLATEGRFQDATTLLKEALAQFPRSDGKELLTKLEKVVIAKECFSAGLLAEKAGQLDIARVKYQAALTHLPDLTECSIRLGIVALKNHNPSQALSLLKEISGEQAAYIRGLAYTKQGRWQQAKQEWRSISASNVEAQRQILETLVRRERLLTMKKIEQLVDNENLEQAKLTSFEFINKFGVDVLVQCNLDGHIQPRLETKIWKSQDWNKIATTAQQFWLEKQDIKSLHNWAVASYYQTQIDSTKLATLITAWSTALANIRLNPSLKNLPWLGGTSVDLNKVSSSLKQLLEVSIDAVKDRDVKEYLRLRDLYRQEMVALDLMRNSPSCGMKVKELFITPGCYQSHRDKLPSFIPPAKLWGALYTDWGLAVAACLEGDVSRAIQLKPSLTPVDEVGRFAHSFVSYHEGCYYLQNQSWRKVTAFLKQAKAEINAHSDWREEIDRLCSLQRQKIENFDEHLEFAQFWFELLGSHLARSYFAEYKTEQIREKLANKKISISQGLSELKEIKKIDERNPVVLELIKNIEILQRMEEIINLIKRDCFEKAVRNAKHSAHKEVRYRTAEFLIDLLLRGVKSQQLHPDAVLQLGCWAKELCPDEPVFQEIYRSLGLSY